MIADRLKMKVGFMMEVTEDIIGRNLELCIGETPILHGTIEGYANGEFTVACMLTDTQTGDVRYAQVKISPNDKNMIFSMTVQE